MPLDLDAATIPLLVTGVLTLLFAGVLLAIDPRSRPARWLAAALALRAGNTFAFALSRDWIGRDGQVLLLSLLAGVTVCGLYATIGFAHAYLRPAAAARERLAVTSTLVALAVATLTAMAARPDWVATYRLFREGYGLVSTGPLNLFLTAGTFTSAVVGFLIARHAIARWSGVRREAGLVLSLGFLFTAAYGLAARGLWIVVAPERALYEPRDDVFVYLNALPLAATLVLLARAKRLRLHAIGIGLGLALGTLVVVLLLTSASGSAFNTFASAISRLALPGLGAYALLRHQVFGLDARAKLAWRKGALPLSMLALFLFGWELASSWLQDALGLVAGAATAAIAVVVAPAAKRITARLGTEEAPRDARALYRQQAEVAWADGVPSKRERAMLDALRARLDLSETDAALIEGEVTRAMAR